jgi:predicted PurR-regulated permease PerM
MKKEHIAVALVLFITFLSFYLLYIILAPFLAPIFWAILLAMVSYPVFKRIQRVLKNRVILSSLVMTLLIILVIVIPFTLLMTSLANEVIGAYNAVEEMIRTGRLQAYVEELRKVPAIQTIWARLDRSGGLSESQPFDFLLKNIQQISTFLFNQSSKILKGLSTFLFSFFFTLLSLYFFFKDGDRLFLRVKEVLPGPPKDRALLIGRFQAMVKATVFGGILIAILQGVLGGLAYWVLGLHSPVLWGTAMAFFSFIPVGGTALIWGPTCLILFIQGIYLEGILLLLIGVLVIGTTDNFLRPFFISSKTKIHPLLLFFAVLGGIQVFGLIGVVAGPLVATVCLTLFEIYAQGIHSRDDSEMKPHP